MKYCKKTDNELSFPDELPNRSGNIAGGFDKMPKSEIQKHGFYPYIEPVFDTVLQMPGKLIFNPKKNTVTREIKTIEFDIVQEKAKKVKEAKIRANGLLFETDWLVIKMIERKIDIPGEVTARRESILSQVENIEAEINLIESVKEVLNYQINFI